LSLAILGGSSDRKLARNLVDRELAGENTVNLAGDLSLIETAAVLKHAAVFVGNDSGLAHLARALGIPTVVLFGPCDPQKWSLPGPEHVVIHKGLACSPCAAFGYRKWCREIPCMTSITAGEVLDAVLGVLS
jgi:ADP-heptose:LPS heptosyltransferase